MLSIAEKSKHILPIGGEKLEEIYLDIDSICKHNVEFDPVETYKEIKKIIDIITKYENIEEVSEGIVFGYITKKGQPNSFEKLTKYGEYLKQFERLRRYNSDPE